jgi:hypothetical protein
LQVFDRIVVFSAIGLIDWIPNRNLGFNLVAPRNDALWCLGTDCDLLRPLSRRVLGIEWNAVARGMDDDPAATPDGFD